MSIWDEDSPEHSPAAAPKKQIEKDTALEMSILFGMLAAQGVDKGDTERYRKVVLETFSTMLDGFGYVVVKKEL